MKKYATMMLRIILILITIFIVTLSVIGMISLIKEPINALYSYILYPIVIFLYLSSVFIYLSFYQTNKFLKLLDNHKVISVDSISIMSKIKVYGLIFAIIYFIALPFFYLLADLDDAPGIIFIGLMMFIGGVIVSLFAEIITKLINEGLKTNNE